jgi:photosynthetic reaction center cytochrome c subunit
MSRIASQERRGWRALVPVLLLTVGVAGCERPPPDVVQRGFRGVGMEHVANPRRLDALVQANIAPEPLPQVPSTGPKAADVYQNVQVLGDLSVGEFTRIMAAITEWVAPEQGCTYCHEGNNFAEDNVYTKKVARTMLAMTQRANEEWQTHVGAVGVTCYTCHRGQNVPAQVWVTDPGPAMAGALGRTGQNIASESVGFASLPYDPFTPYLLQDMEIRLAGNTALPTGNRTSIKRAEWTYGLMMHFSNALGVNCTYCHNSRAWSDWEQSPPTRVTAWHGIRMVREMNNDYITPTESYLPDYRKGPEGDAQKVYCATCHQGAYKPLFGAEMLKHYPSLATQSDGARKLFGN